MNPLENRVGVRETVTVYPLPEESVYSILARIHIRSGKRSPLNSLKKLTSVRGYKPLSGLPTHLNEIVLRSGLSTTADLLAYRHTDYPLYTHFLSSRRCANVKRSMFAFGSSKSRLGLLRSHVGAGDTRRFCNECARHDVLRYGFPYWRRGFSLPGFLICPVHRHVLVECSADDSSPRERALELPPASRSLPSFCDPALNGLQSIAVFYQQLLCFPRRIGFSTGFYRRSYRSSGLLTSGGSIRQAQLVAAVRSYLEPLKEVAPFDRLYKATVVERSWVATLADRGPGFHHPLKHILVWLALDLSVDDVICMSDGAHEQLNFDLQLPDFDPSDEEIAEVFATSNSLTTAARQLGWSVNTAVAWAELHSIHFSRRPKKVTMDVRRRILRYCERHSTARAAQHFNLSVTTINRVRRIAR